MTECKIVYGVNMGSAVCMFQKFMNSVGIRESGPLSSFGQGFVAFIHPAVPFIGNAGTVFLRQHTS